MNYCPYCGRRLAQDARFCGACGYELGTDLGLGVLAAPPPMLPNDVVEQKPFREGRFHPPAHPFHHAGLPTSKWDGRVHTVVKDHGRLLWDGHDWVPNPAAAHAPAEGLRDAVADTPAANRLSPSGVVGVVFTGIVGTVLIFWFVIQVVKGMNGPVSDSWYLHFNCGGDPQCIGSTVGSNGQNTGILGAHASQADCEYAKGPFQRIGAASAYWCSSSSNPADPGP